MGLELQLDVELSKEAKEDEILIKEQTPKPGIKVNKGSKINAEI